MSLPWEAAELHTEIGDDKEDTIIAVVHSSVNIPSSPADGIRGQEEEQGCISLCQLN